MDRKVQVPEGVPNCKVAPEWAIAPAQQGQLILVAQDVDGKTDRHKLDDKAAYILGRHATACDFIAPRKCISRYHCHLVHAGEVRVDGAAVAPLAYSVASHRAAAPSCAYS